MKKARNKKMWVVEGIGQLPYSQDRRKIKVIVLAKDEKAALTKANTMIRDILWAPYTWKLTNWKLENPTVTFNPYDIYYVEGL